MEDLTLDMSKPAHRVCVKLNELFAIDPEPFKKLIDTRYPVNDELAEHADIIVTGESTMGALSLLNVIFTTEFDDRIAAIYDDETEELLGLRPWSTTQTNKSNGSSNQS